MQRGREANRHDEGRVRGPMAWDESKAWLSGSTQGNHYRSLLEEATDMPRRNAQRRKIVHPDEMPWEMSRQGLLKHLLNAGMNTRMETVDAYMQIIPPFFLSDTQPPVT